MRVLCTVRPLIDMASYQDFLRHKGHFGPTMYAMATQTMWLRTLQGNEDTLGLVRPEEADLLNDEYLVWYLIPVCRTYDTTGRSFGFADDGAYQSCSE